MAEVEHVLQPIAAGRFVVDQRCMRRVDGQLAGLVRAQAEIQVVVDDLVRFVEAAERLEDVAAHQHAGAGHRDDVALGQRQAEIARVVRRREAEGVARDARRREEHAGVLHLAVRIQQLRPDDRHFRPLRMFQQGVQPVRLDDLDVVVEEQQVFAVGCCSADDC